MKHIIMSSHLLNIFFESNYILHGMIPRSDEVNLSLLYWSHRAQSEAESSNRWVSNITLFRLSTPLSFLQAYWAHVAMVRSMGFYRVVDIYLACWPSSIKWLVFWDHYSLRSWRSRFVACVGQQSTYTLVRYSLRKRKSKLLTCSNCGTRIDFHVFKIASVAITISSYFRFKHCCSVVVQEDEL